MKTTTPCRTSSNNRPRRANFTFFTLPGSPNRKSQIANRKFALLLPRHPLFPGRNNQVGGGRNKSEGKQNRQLIPAVGHDDSAGGVEPHSRGPLVGDVAGESGVECERLGSIRRGADA